MAIGNMHEKLVEDRMRSFEDMITDSHTQTLVTIHCSPVGDGIMNACFNKIGKRHARYVQQIKGEH